MKGMEKALFNVKFIAVSDLIRLRKQYGTVLVLLPTLWSLFMASGGIPDAKFLVIFTVGAFLMRSAGCAVNDIADRNFDKHVERTKSRPVAEGRLSGKEALAVFIILSLAAFSLVLFLNRYTILLSTIGIALAVVYPFVKRVSHFPQVVLGIAFGWGAVMAWAAVRNELGPEAILIFVANIFWSTAYDTVYAMMDVTDDVKIGVKSTAIFFGQHVFRALVALYICFVAVMFMAGWVDGLGVPFYMVLLLVLGASLFMVKRLKDMPTRETAFRVFVANCLTGGMILFGIIFSMERI